MLLMNYPPSLLFTGWGRPDFIFLFFDRVSQNETVQGLDFTILDQAVHFDFERKQRLIALGIKNLKSTTHQP